MMLQSKPFNRWQRLLAWYEGDSHSLKRLSDALPTCYTRLNLHIARNVQTPPWALISQQCLENAKNAFDRSGADEGWSCLLEAERLEVEGYSRGELAALLISLQKETQSKLKDWRQQSTKELLTIDLAETTHDKQNTVQGSDDTPGKAPTDVTNAANIARVQEALRLRNEHFHNQYTRIRIQRLQLSVAGLFVAAALLTTILVGVWGAPLIGEKSADMLRLAALFGLLGGALSTAVSLARNTYQRIPEHLSSWSTTLIRPVLGSGAAVAAFVFLKAGQVSFGKLNDDWAILAISFLAGFSEQWFLRVVGDSGGKTQ